jgi:hypothetical protein
MYLTLERGQVAFQTRRELITELLAFALIVASCTQFFRSAL